MDTLQWAIDMDDEVGKPSRKERAYILMEHGREDLTEALDETENMNHQDLVEWLGY